MAFSPDVAPQAQSIQHEAPPSIPTSAVVFDPENMTREERIKHHIARQFALGPLGDPSVTAPRYRLSDVYTWDDGSQHYADGRSVDDSYFKNDTTIDPAHSFSSPEEFSSLVIHYQSRLTSEERDAIRVEEETLDTFKLGQVDKASGQ